jgi:hypothetical protein
MHVAAPKTTESIRLDLLDQFSEELESGPDQFVANQQTPDAPTLARMNRQGETASHDAQHNKPDKFGLCHKHFPTSHHPILAIPRTLKNRQSQTRRLDPNAGERGPETSQIGQHGPCNVLSTTTMQSSNRKDLFCIPIHSARMRASHFRKRSGSFGFQDRRIGATFRPEMGDVLPQLLVTKAIRELQKRFEQVNDKSVHIESHILSFGRKPGFAMTVHICSNMPETIDGIE